MSPRETWRSATGIAIRNLLASSRSPQSAVTAFARCYVARSAVPIPGRDWLGRGVEHRSRRRV